MPGKGDIIIGRYEVAGVIGSGGTSTVYLVIDRHIGKTLAMKVMDRKKMGAYGFARSEIESMRHIRYPLVPRIMDAFCDDGSIYILSEYVKGESLAVMCRNKGMPRDASLTLAQRICEALIYLHEMKKPILYLDMKPENIIISEDGMPHLIDFGIAGWLAKKHIAVGTVGYSPPEQYKPGAVMDAAADIYAFGMTYYAIRSGVPPDADPLKALHNIKHSKTLCSYEKSFLKKCCALSKDDRYKSARDVLRQIKHIRSIPNRLKRTLVLAALSAGIIISGCCITAKISNAASQNEAAVDLVKDATRYMVDGEYTPEGIGIIKACINSGRLPEDCEQEFIFEVAMNSMLVSGDYKTAAAYFDRLDENRFPEAADYKQLCTMQSRFDYDPGDAAEVTGRIFSDIIKRAPSKIKYENMIFIANCFEYYDENPADGYAKALSVLEIAKEEIDEQICGESAADQNDLTAIRDRIVSLIEVKQQRMRTRKKITGVKHEKETEIQNTMHHYGGYNGMRICRMSCRSMRG